MEAWPSGVMLIFVEPLLGKRPGGWLVRIVSHGCAKWQSGVQEFVQSSARSNDTHYYQNQGEHELQDTKMITHGLQKKKQIMHDVHTFTVSSSAYLKSSEILWGAI